MVAQFFVNDRRRADPNRLIRFSLQFAAAVNFLENRGAAQKITPSASNNCLEGFGFSPWWLL
jgi:hypothetical protein